MKSCFLRRASDSFPPGKHRAFAWHLEPFPPQKGPTGVCMAFAWCLPDMTALHHAFACSDSFTPCICLRPCLRKLRHRKVSDYSIRTFLWRNFSMTEPFYDEIFRWRNSLWRSFSMTKHFYDETLPWRSFLWWNLSMPKFSTRELFYDGTSLTKHFYDGIPLRRNLSMT